MKDIENKTMVLEHAVSILRRQNSSVDVKNGVYCSVLKLIPAFSFREVEVVIAAFSNYLFYQFKYRHRNNKY